MDHEAALNGNGISNLDVAVTPTQMFERTMTLLRENFRLFLGIVSIAVGIEVLVAAVLGASDAWTYHSVNGSSPFFRSLVVLPLGLFGGVLIYLITQIVQGALFFATQARIVGSPMTVSDACKLAIDKIGKIIGISLLVALRVLGYIALFYFGLVIVVFAAAAFLGGVAALSGQGMIRSAASQSIGTYMVLAMLTAVVLIMYAGLLLWLAARYATAIPAGLAEDLSIGEAIHRSVRLSARNKGRLYALVLVVGGLWFAITMISLPLQFMLTYQARAHHTISVATIGLIALFIGIFRILLSGGMIAFFGVGIPICYYDLRARAAATDAVPPAATLTVATTTFVPVTEQPPNGPPTDVPLP